MKGHRRISLRVRRGDILVALVLLACMIGALLLWPDKILADVAVPTAVLIAFVVWRDRT
jgi:hypothetical protein